MMSFNSIQNFLVHFMSCPLGVMVSVVYSSYPLLGFVSDFYSSSVYFRNLDEPVFGAYIWDYNFILLDCSLDPYEVPLLSLLT